MPWKETCAMKERLQMVSLYETGKYTVTELANHFSVSRKTAHKWLGRFANEGVLGLNERSRAPHRCPKATPAEVALAVVRAKQAHPTWGPAKLAPCPDEAPEIASMWPAVSTRGRILSLHGLVTRRKHRRRSSPWFQPFLGADRPNNVWGADFKGWIRTGDGTRCDPLTISDACTRMFLCCDILTKPDYAHVRPVFERVFRENGLPLAIRTDNGPPFASVGSGGLSLLSVWWIKLGIMPERIKPGHPEQNGRHERLHLTLKQEVMNPPAASPQAQQERCDNFLSIYNKLRPHEALGQVPPASRYTPSSRLYPEQLGDIEYPPLTEVRRVRSNGQIKWRGELIFVSEVLIGELVGITEDKNSWLVSFGPIPLGLLYPHRLSLSPIPPTHPSNHHRSVTHVFS
ncbi:integrase core domain-containing protein [Chloroflexota bacterium]